MINNICLKTIRLLIFLNIFSRYLATQGKPLIYSFCELPFFLVYLVGYYRLETMLLSPAILHFMFSLEKHYLLYKFTAMTKTDTSVVFMAVGESDDKQIAHYRNEETAWFRENLTDWTDAPAEPPETREWYINNLYDLSNCTFAECPELHVLQRIIGCELEKRTNKTKIVDDYGYDGNDLSLDSDTGFGAFINPLNKETKNKWHSRTEPNQFLKGFLKNCMDWISIFNNRIKSKPYVFVSARKAPDDHSQLVLTCLSTGFYPRDVQMNIRFNRITLEDQTSSGIRPNEDETFQMSISVKINRNHEGSHDCLVTHSSLTEPVTVEWDGTCSNCEPEPPWDVIAGVIAAVLVLAGIGIGIGIGIRHYYKRRRPNDPMTRSPIYGSMEDHSQNDQSQEDQSEEDQSEEDQSEEEL